MKLLSLFKLYLTTLAICLTMDMLWLGTIAHSFYTDQIGFLIAKSPNLFAAGLFYLLFAVGILVFAVFPALKEKKPKVQKALLLGGLFGFFTYCTYDLTNMATIENWPLVLTVVDVVWGVFLSATVAALSFLIGKKIFV